MVPVVENPFCSFSHQNCCTSDSFQRPSNMLLQWTSSDHWINGLVVNVLSTPPHLSYSRPLLIGWSSHSLLSCSFSNLELHKLWLNQSAIPRFNFVLWFNHWIFELQLNCSPYRQAGELSCWGSEGKGNRKKGVGRVEEGVQLRRVSSCGYLQQVMLCWSCEPTPCTVEVNNWKPPGRIWSVA